MARTYAVQTPAPARPDPGLDRFVDDAKACVRCGYNLRGLKVSGDCPECGTAVKISLGGKVLRHSDPAYLMALQRGLALVLTALALYVLVLIVTLGLKAFTTLADEPWYPVAEYALYAGAALLGVLGYWLFSAPDPALTESETPHSARRIIRAAALAQAAIKLGQLALVIATAASPPTSVAAATASAGAAVMGLVLVADFGSFAVLIIGAVLHTRWLALRVPDAGLAGKCRTLVWLLPVAFVLGAPLLCIGPIAAIVLYAGMLSDLRTDVMDVLDWRERGGQYRG